MKAIIKFNDWKCDLEKLKSELKLLEEGDWHEHFSGYDPGWKAIPLISLGGSVDSNANSQGEGNIHELASKYKKTFYLKKLPYTNKLINQFSCRKLRTRIMKMSPGAVIDEHVDTQGWRHGIARMHIPIITHDEVYFYVDGNRAKMEEGELWYLDVTRPHSVKNLSDITRVHLVIDLLINPYVRNFFPKEPIKDQVFNYYQNKKSFLFETSRKLGFTKALKVIRNKV